MEDNDDDYIPPDVIADSPPARNLRRRPHQATTEVVPANSAKKPRYEEKTAKPRIPNNLRSVSALKKAVTKRLQGTDFTPGLSLRVVRAALLMQEDYLLEKRRCSVQNRSQMKPAKIRERVCHLFGISAPTYSAILSNYLTNQTKYLSGRYGEGRSGNMATKETRIPDTKAVQNRVREFVRERRAKRQ